MDRLSKFMLITAIPVILFGATLDWWLLTKHSFWNYVYICAWEYTIFWFGIETGKKLIIKETANKGLIK